MSEKGEATREQVNELNMTRTFDAPLRVVWKAWTDPKQVAQWWGPPMFTAQSREWDARPGGAIRLEVHRPDGMDEAITGAFVDVVEPFKLVFMGGALHDGAGNPQLETLNTVTFDDLGDRTQVNVHIVLLKVGADAATVLSGMEEGWRQQMEKLAALVRS